MKAGKKVSSSTSSVLSARAKNPCGVVDFETAEAVEKKAGPAFTTSVATVTVSSNGAYAICVDASGQVCLYDTAGAKVLRTFNWPGVVGQIEISNDGTIALVRTKDKVTCYNLVSSKHMFEPHEGVARTVSLSHDGRFAAIATDNEAVLLNTRNGREVANFIYPDSEAYPLTACYMQIVPDGPSLFIGGTEAGKVFVWESTIEVPVVDSEEEVEIPSLKPVMTVEPDLDCPSAVVSIGINKSHTAAVVAFKRHLCVIDLDNGWVRTTFPLYTNPVVSYDDDVVRLVVVDDHHSVVTLQSAKQGYVTLWGTSMNETHANCGKLVSHVTSPDMKRNVGVGVSVDGGFVTTAASDARNTIAVTKWCLYPDRCMQARMALLYWLRREGLIEGAACNIVDFIITPPISVFRPGQLAKVKVLEDSIWLHCMVWNRRSNPSLETIDKYEYEVQPLPLVEPFSEEMEPYAGERFPGIPSTYLRELPEYDLHETERQYRARVQCQVEARSEDLDLIMPLVDMGYEAAEVSKALRVTQCNVHEAADLLVKENGVISDVKIIAMDDADEGGEEGTTQLPCWESSSDEEPVEESLTSKVTKLEKMGFQKGQALDALQRNSYDLQAAIEQLIKVREEEAKRKLMAEREAQAREAAETPAREPEDPLHSRMGYVTVQDVSRKGKGVKGNNKGGKGNKGDKGQKGDQGGSGGGEEAGGTSAEHIEKVGQLVAMGFEPLDAEKALLRSDWDLMRAANALINQG